MAPRSPTNEPSSSTTVRAVSSWPSDPKRQQVLAGLGRPSSCGAAPPRRWSWRRRPTPRGRPADRPARSATAGSMASNSSSRVSGSSSRSASAASSGAISATTLAVWSVGSSRSRLMRSSTSISSSASAASSVPRAASSSSRWGRPEVLEQVGQLTGTQPVQVLVGPRQAHRLAGVILLGEGLDGGPVDDPVRRGHAAPASGTQPAQQGGEPDVGPHQAHHVVQPGQVQVGGPEHAHAVHVDHLVVDHVVVERHLARAGAGRRAGRVGPS